MVNMIAGNNSGAIIVDGSRHQGNVALLTGAGSGIGLATAERMAAEGAAVVGCDINPSAVEAAREAVPDGTFSVVDVTDPAATEEMVAETLAAHGRIDVVGNIAGIHDFMLAAHEIDDVTWDRVIAVNATAVMSVCRAVLPSMMERGAGSIVNMASIAGTGGAASGLAYTASKHAVIGITRSIAWTYRPEGIRCNAVCPGAVSTNIMAESDPISEFMFERVGGFHALKGRRAEADEIAALVSWLGCAEASNLNGAIVTADNGWTAG